jgi:predicted tellurium resistance membrane protein TerC
MMELLSNPETWIAFLTLTFLEIVLGIDNIIFVSIVTNRLPVEKQGRARSIGLSMAMIMRIALLAGLGWLIRVFEEPLFSVLEFDISGRDLILFFGGLFLIAKSTTEIRHKVEGHSAEEHNRMRATSVASVIFQVLLMDVIFSFDSILTAIGLSDQLPVMMAAVVVAVLIMLVFSGPISRYISKHPSLEILALSFLILIGFMLVVDALHQEVPKGYIYFAVFFSLGVELVNMRADRNRKKKKVEGG